MMFSMSLVHFLLFTILCAHLSTSESLPGLEIVATAPAITSMFLWIQREKEKGCKLSESVHPSEGPFLEIALNAFHTSWTRIYSYRYLYQEGRRGEWKLGGQPASVQPTLPKPSLGKGLLGLSGPPGLVSVTATERGRLLPIGVGLPGAGAMSDSLSIPSSECKTWFPQGKQVMREGMSGYRATCFLVSVVLEQRGGEYNA